MKNIMFWKNLKIIIWAGSFFVNKIYRLEDSEAKNEELTKDRDRVKRENNQIPWLQKVVEKHEKDIDELKTDKLDLCKALADTREELSISENSYTDHKVEDVLTHEKMMVIFMAF